MKALELKIPPPVVTLLVATLMWGLWYLTPSLALPASVREPAAAVIALAGGCLAFAGIVSFRRAKTTINPLTPEKTSTLVVSGVYRYTRNPMYTGLLVALVAWALFLSAPCALAGPALFMLYIGRFQIVPEERALRAQFGAAFETYAAKVRRWL